MLEKDQKEQNSEIGTVIGAAAKYFFELSKRDQIDFSNNSNKKNFLISFFYLGEKSENKNNFLNSLISLGNLLKKNPKLFSHLNSGETLMESNLRESSKYVLKLDNHLKTYPLPTGAEGLEISDYLSIEKQLVKVIKIMNFIIDDGKLPQIEKLIKSKLRKQNAVEEIVEILSKNKDSASQALRESLYNLGEERHGLGFSKSNKYIGLEKHLKNWGENNENPLSKMTYFINKISSLSSHVFINEQEKKRKKKLAINSIALLTTIIGGIFWFSANSKNMGKNTPPTPTPKISDQSADPISTENAQDDEQSPTIIPEETLTPRKEFLVSEIEKATEFKSSILDENKSLLGTLGKVIDFSVNNELEEDFIKSLETIFETYDILQKENQNLFSVVEKNSENQTKVFYEQGLKEELIITITQNDDGTTSAEVSGSYMPPDVVANLFIYNPNSGICSAKAKSSLPNGDRQENEIPIPENSECYATLSTHSSRRILIKFSEENGKTAVSVVVINMNFGEKK